jgi:hypothetical protein
MPLHYRFSRSTRSGVYVANDGACQVGASSHLYPTSLLAPRLHPERCRQYIYHISFVCNSKIYECLHKFIKTMQEYSVVMFPLES